MAAWALDALRVARADPVARDAFEVENAPAPLRVVFGVGEEREDIPRGQLMTISLLALGIGGLLVSQERAELVQAAPPAVVVHVHWAGPHEVVVIDAGPSARRSAMARRVGSASAAKTASRLFCSYTEVRRQMRPAADRPASAIPPPFGCARALRVGDEHDRHTSPSPVKPQPAGWG